MKCFHGSRAPAVTAILLAALSGCDGIPVDSFDGLLGGIGAINAVAPAGEPLPELGEAVIIRVINLSDDRARVIVRYLIADIEVRRTDIQVPGGSTAQDIGPDNAFQVEITATGSDGTPLPSMSLTLGVDFVGGQIREYVIRPGEPQDRCPDDPAKTAPGVCGCGVPDIDTDRDGTYDCNDACPDDPAKTAPGVCGCGAADADSDADGIVDCIDNCPGKANADQADCDGDGAGDACVIEDCPGLPGCGDCNENGVPDACDLGAGVSLDSNGDGIPDECDAPPPCRLYVRADADGLNDGSDWNNAFNDLQDALAAARNHGGPCEIRIARGIYKPDRDTGDRTASFLLPCGASLLGGFSGTGTTPDERNPDPLTNGCVLSGDLLGNDGPVAWTGDSRRSDNSYHVAIFEDSCGADTIIDGLAFVGGNANGSAPHSKGGGFLISFFRGRIANCLFTGHSALSGGAIFLYDGDPVFDRCIFAFNSADSFAGAIEIYESRATILNSLLVANISGGKGGAMDFWLNHPGPRLAITIANCTFAGNQAAAVGGGLSGVVGSGYEGALEIINSVFWGHTAGQGGPQDAHLSVSGLRPQVSYSCIPSPGVYPGIGNIALNPGFAAMPPPSPTCTFGSPGWSFGDLRLTPWSPCIDAGSNTAPSAAGPLDLAGGPRRLDDPGTPDSGCGSPPIVDMGAYEFASTSPARQACCFNADDCSDLTLEDCLHWEGIPQGPGTTCATTSCEPPPTQACCLDQHESCLNLPVDACLDQGGEPQGPGTDCETANCGL